MSPRALVTGATGMLGGYVVRRLLEDGWRVRALVRDPSRGAHLARLGVELAAGDLVDRTAVRAAVRGCDGVVHAAAEIGSGGDAARYEVVNVRGTERIVRAAERVEARLVLVSSTAVFGRSRYHARPTGECTPLPLLPEKDAYGRSKQEAERRVLTASAAGTLWAAVVRPPVMYGIGDRQLAPRVGPVLERGLFPLVEGGRTRLGIVHADAVAHGAVRALCADHANGRVYHLTDDFPLTVAEFVALAGEGLARRVRTPSLSIGAARLGMGVLRAVLCSCGRPDLARHGRGTLDMLTRDNPFTSERARSELGWSPRIRPQVGVPEAFRVWRDGRLPAGGG